MPLLACREEPERSYKRFREPVEPGITEAVGFSAHRSEPYFCVILERGKCVDDCPVKYYLSCGVVITKCIDRHRGVPPVRDLYEVG